MRKNRVQAIRNAAASQESATTGITDDNSQARNDLADQTLDTAATACAGLKAAPPQAAAGSRGGTASVPQLISDTRSAYRNQIDKLMTPFRKPHADFYAGDFAPRVINDRAASHAPAKKPTTP